MIEGLESSKQGEVRGNNGKVCIVTVAKLKGTPLKSVMQRCIVIYERRMITFSQGVLNSGLPS
jgi:hypothetical protein